MTLEPGIAEASWSGLGIAPASNLALSIRATNEHDVVLVEIGEWIDANAPARIGRFFCHRAHLIQLARVFGYWRTAYGSGPHTTVEAPAERIAAEGGLRSDDV